VDAIVAGIFQAAGLLPPPDAHRVIDGFPFLIANLEIIFFVGRCQNASQFFDFLSYDAIRRYPWTNQAPGGTRQRR